MARAVGLQRRFDEARALLDEAVLLLPEAGAVAVIRYQLESGRVHNSAGDSAAAIPHFKRAWKAARAAAEDGYAVDAAHMLAIAAETGEETLAWNERALELAEASEDERARRWRAALLNNLGWARHDGGDYEAALSLFERALFERALAERQKHGPNRETRIARWCVARCLRSLGRLEEALAQQHELLAEEVAAGEAAGFTWEEIGECLLALGRDAEARLQRLGS